MQLWGMWKCFLLLLKEIMTFCHWSWILLTSLRKYFLSSISADQYNWVRNPFVESEPSAEGQVTLAEEEELAGIANDRTLMIKHSELNLAMHSGCYVSRNAQKALRLLIQFNFLCKFGFLVMATIKHKKREALLYVEELQVCLSKTQPKIQALCRNCQASEIL